VQYALARRSGAEAATELKAALYVARPDNVTETLGTMKYDAAEVVVGQQWDRAGDGCRCAV
jgi:hypothetical protein